MPGRVTGLLRDRFLALQADLLRGPHARTTDREEAIVAIVVAGAGAVGGFADRLRLRQLLTMRRQQWRPIMLPWISLPRRWRW